ncbi:MAG: TPM domain-containing protein [Cellvibrio sp.]
MTLINPDQQQSVAELIAEIERHTDAELVAVVARQSDDYRYIPVLWAAALALLVPLPVLFAPFWLTTADVLLVQWLTFLFLAALFRIPALRIRLIPRSVRYRRAANMACRQFLENNLHHTSGETGVLLFVSEAERYVEIIADRGISQLVPQSQWQGLIDEFISAVKAGRTHEGLINCIKGCGTILQQQVPATRDKNELPNHLILL